MCEWKPGNTIKSPVTGRQVATGGAVRLGSPTRPKPPNTISASDSVGTSTYYATTNMAFLWICGK